MDTLRQLVARGNKIKIPKVCCPLSDFGLSLFASASSEDESEDDSEEDDEGKKETARSVGAIAEARRQIPALRGIATPGAVPHVPQLSSAWSHQPSSVVASQSPAVLPAPVCSADTTPEERLLNKVLVILSRSDVMSKPVRACQLKTIFEVQFLDSV